jgi:hypothetical protein
MFGVVGPLMRHIRRLLIVYACWTAVVSARPYRHEAGTQPTVVTPFVKRLARRVERFDTSGRTLVACVVDLAYQYQLPMALEYVDHDATTRPLNLQFHNESVRRILEGIIRQAPEFRISFAEGLVDIFAPQGREDTSSLFNKVIKDFAVTKLDTHEADLVLACALGRETGASFCGGSIAGGQWPSLQITLHLEDAKVYEILNAIVAQNGKAIWALMVRPENLSKPQSGNLWYVYPLQQPFKSSVLERLTRMER